MHPLVYHTYRKQQSYTFTESLLFAKIKTYFDVEGSRITYSESFFFFSDLITAFSKTEAPEDFGILDLIHLRGLQLLFPRQ